MWPALGKGTLVHGSFSPHCQCGPLSPTPSSSAPQGNGSELPVQTGSPFFLKVTGICFKTQVLGDKDFLKEISLLGQKMGSGLRREKFSPVLRNPECLVGQIVCKIEPDSPPTRYACPFLCGFAALPNKGHSSFPLEFCTSCKPRPQETCKRKRSSMALLPESEGEGRCAKSIYSLPYH